MSGATILSAIDLRVELRSRRGSFTLTADALDINAREALVILGPNGSGKSTLVRALAGLERPVGGRVASVATGPAERRARVGEALERFKIDHLAEHRAATLSGGELRRLALSRAFALRPAVLLLDEPFAALDTDGQAALSLDLRRAISDTGVAVAMVTHDLRRAMLLADRIAVLVDGRLAQVGRRDDVIERPDTPEIAQVVGMTNLVQGVVVEERRGELALVEVDAQHRVTTRSGLAVGTRVWVVIRPEHLKVDVGRGDVDPIGKGIVREVVNDGVAVTIQVDWAGTELRTHLMAGRGLARTVQAGMPVSLSASPEHVHLISISSN